MLLWGYEALHDVTNNNQWRSCRVIKLPYPNGAQKQFGVFYRLSSWSIFSVYDNVMLSVPMVLVYKA